MFITWVYLANCVIIRALSVKTVSTLYINVDYRIITCCHRGSFFQSLQKPIAVMSIDGNLDSKSAIFSLKLLFGETLERKYLMMHKR